jgi:glucose-1-phosphate adenylyltransferase
MHSLVFEDSTVGNSAHISHSVLLPNVKVGNNVSIKNAIIDSNCVIPDNLQIGESKKEDLERGFRLSSNGIVLVTQKMLQNLTLNQCKYLPLQNFNGADLLKGKVSQLN